MSSNNKRSFYISTISGNSRKIFSDLQEISKSDIVDGIHFDVMDGIFVPRLGLYPELLREIRAETQLTIEVHCMLTKPSLYVQQLIDCGADRLLFHIESEEQIEALIRTTRKLKKEVGIVLNPNTPIGSVSSLLSTIDYVMLMGINPGIPKHPLIQSTMPRLKELKQRIVNSQNPNLKISIDGGVTFQNATELFESGADSLVCGSGTIFNPINDLWGNLLDMRAIKLQ